jgi:acyl-CoA reductase-like NAD-dependent aldehyde dehydrogenase
MLPVYNPATGQVIRELEEDTPLSVSEKYKAAAESQRQWRKSTIETRLQVIKKFRELVVSKEQSLAETLTLEMGKPITQSRNELRGLLTRIDFFLENTPHVLKSEVVHKEQGLEEIISFEPLGVVGNISAWNYPYFVGSNVFLPALLTGNSVLYKPSEFAAMTGARIGELFAEAGLPQGNFQVLIGKGNIGSELLRQPIDAIFFTGSYATGKKIAALAGEKMIKQQLELGGKDPVYICEDVEVAQVAAATADGAFYNNGQSCCSVERIYVHEKIWEHFVGKFAEAVKGFVVGDPMKEETYIGPLAREAQIAVIERQIADARKKGGKILCGGNRLSRPGYYFEPTVISDATHEMELMREESFGPIIGLERVSDDEEALEKMNDTQYGLTAGIYTKSQERALGILSAVNSGTGYWNCCDRVSPRLPWSGRRHSGLGSTLSEEGIRIFLQPKALHLRK